MRTRAPLLYHQYVGQFQPQEPPPKSGKLSESILHQHDQLQAATALRQQEQAQLGNVGEEEEESDESSDRSSQLAVETPTVSKYGPESDAASNVVAISAQELQENREELIQILQAQFLQGKDSSMDYSKIDHDELGLDDDNAAEADRDAVDKHFESGD